MIEVSHGVAWLITAFLIEAAIIDGRKLKVPNWLTLHLTAVGIAFAAWSGGWPALAWSLKGAATGLLLLLPLYAIGGMGAGDVKLLAGVGAWIGPTLTFGAFAASAVVGGVMALAMIAWSGQYARHWAQFQIIGNEIITIRDPAKLSVLAAERKPTMMLLPYGIPLAMGSISYLAWAGLLF